MHKSKKTSIVGIVITAVLLILLVILTNLNSNIFFGIENVFNKIVMPIQNGLTHLKNKVAKNDAFFEDIEELKKENEKLEQENIELQSKLKELELIKTENATLRQYVNMAEQYTEYTTIPADIINKDISNLSNTMVINIGKKNGIDVNMPVITKEGIVGYIISVTDSTAKIEPIIDPANSVSSLISTSKDGVVVKGILRKQ